MSKRLTPYDKGEVFQPIVWPRPHPKRGNEGDWGKVDFENDEGGAAATLRVVPSSTVGIIVEIDTDYPIHFVINGTPAGVSLNNHP